jgi:asparagine N-glycosylation enzyme membrane subunit Stt3
MFLEFLVIFGVAALFSISGVLLAFGLLRGIRFDGTEKTIVGILLGLLANPLLSYLEFAFFSAKLDSKLILANVLLVSFFGLALLHKQGQLGAFKKTLKKLKERFGAFDARAWAKANPASVLLIVVLLASFYPRVAASWTTDFFEFDPYYYTFITEYLVKDGSIPLQTMDSYYPEMRALHQYPIMHYMTGSWYLLYRDFLGLPYEKDALILTAQLYPALISMLLAFLIFLFVKETYGKWAGLVAAALFALTPQLIQKFAAGVAEFQPFGLFAALLLFAFFAIAVNRKSIRLGFLAGLAAFVNILGSAQYTWSMTVLGAYVILQLVLDFLSGDLDKRSSAIHFLTAAGTLIGSWFLLDYQGSSIASLVTSNPLGLITSLSDSALLAVFALVSAGVVNLVSREKWMPAKFADRAKVLGVLLVLVLAFAAFTPLGQRITNHVLGSAQFAFVQGALQFTIAEENPTSPGLFGPAYGVLNPNLFLALTAVFGAIAFIAYFTGERNKLLLMFLLVVFPASYIGLNKLKYMVHLGLVLTIAAGFILGELALDWKRFNKWLKLGMKESTLHTASFWSVAVLGLLLVAPQAAKVGDSMNGLSNTLIPQDWLDTMNWLRTSSPSNIRVLSWWDYGHWTMFLGERHTVLDPGNGYQQFDWETAHAFVDGSTEDLYKTISYHKAPNETSYVMLDGELIGKWGALVFQSGVYNYEILNRTGKAAIQEWRQGPGKSLYETEHYFEYLSYEGQCPAFASPVPMPMLQSSFGATYCMAQNELLLLTRNGIDYSLKRPYKIMGGEQVSEIDANTSYLFSMGQGKFLNVNPDLRYASLESKLINSAYVHLYFFESLPGFELVYRSPQGLVKIFRTKEEVLKTCKIWPPQLC